jgi:hypothetical protein
MLMRRRFAKALSLSLTLAVALLAMVGMFLASPASAQEEKNPHKDTHWTWSASVTPAQMKYIIDHSGFRIIDLEVARRSPLEFSVVWVKNDGPFARSWWWYYNISGPDVDKSRKKHDAHILDLELMTLKPDARFAVVYVKDPGNNAAWNWTAGCVEMNKMGEYVKSLADSGKRLVDFDPNPDLAYYMTTVEAPNVGLGAVAWWTYINVAPDFIASKINEHGARLVDIERQPGTRFSIILIKSPARWWWYYGRTESEVEALYKKHNGRIVDIETHWRNGVQYFDFIMVSNE